MCTEELDSLLQARIALPKLSRDIGFEMLQAPRIGLHRDTGGRKGHPLEQAQLCLRSDVDADPLQRRSRARGKLVGAHGVCQSQRHRLTDYHFDPALPFPRALVGHGDWNDVQRQAALEGFEGDDKGAGAEWQMPGPRLLVPSGNMNRWPPAARCATQRWVARWLSAWIARSRSLRRATPIPGNIVRPNHERFSWAETMKAAQGAAIK